MGTEQIPADGGIEQVSIQTHDRITARTSFYFSHFSQDPFCHTIINNRFVRSSGIEVYSRRCWADSDWRELDPGWVAREGCIGLIILENLEGKDVVQHLSEEEKKAATGHLLQVAYEGNTDYRFFIYPGDGWSVVPDPAFKLVIRVAAGRTPYRITVFPG